ncbi:MAG: hypothetical protein Q7T54_04800 [Candidatus Levybacteria bacterium]|nr:hypothetical protein [Candidatus Levybacteria bacterium]
MTRRRERSSRLVRTSERQNKKQAILFTLGIVILIGILIQFGPLLINVFGNVVYTLRGGDTSDSVIEGDAVVQPPTLIGIPEATQSGRISFGGIAPSDSGIIEIYVNDKLEDEIKLDSTQFEAKKIDLTKGKNTVKARLVRDDKTSAFTEEYEVLFIADKPKLEVLSPSDSATFTKADKSITVSGTTDPENTVSVNSFRAIVETDGGFSYLLQLTDGDNQITIEAKNPAGVITQKQMKVTYTP